MNGVLRPLASLRLTLVGMLLLAFGAALSYNNPATTSVWVLVAPMSLLAVNLLAAIITNPRINRRGGLLTFHLALLGVVVLAAIGRLTHLEAHIELLQDTAFASAELFDDSRGPWHSGRLDQVQFVQGPYTVDYAPGMVRGLTRSQVQVPDGRGGWEAKVVGDDRPLIMEGYRFYTSFNKGFAPILTWIPDQGAPQTGAVHMPSYPLFEFKQDNSWTPPGGPEIKFWLRLTTGMDEKTAWVLDGSKARGVLVVNTGGQRLELQPGDSAKLPGGQLRYERLSTWMGYKIFYDPTLKWLFMVAMTGVLGMAAHFWRKFGALVPGGTTAAPATGKYSHAPKGSAL